MAEQKNQIQNESTSPENTIEILYQKMGDRWFAFSLIDDEVFVGSISESEIQGNTSSAAGPSDRVMKVHRNIGNS